MNLSNLRRSERVTVAKAEMIVMCSDDEPFILQGRIGPLYGGDYISNRFSRSGNFRRNVDSDIRQVKGLWFQIRIDFLLNRGDILAGGLEKRKERLAPGMYRWYAEIVCFCAACGRSDFFVCMVQVRNEYNSARPVLPGIDGFVDKGRVPCEIRAVKRALRIRFLRFVPQHNDDLVFYIKPPVVIVMKFRRCDAVPCEYQRAVERSSVGKCDRYEILFDSEPRA